MSEQRRDPVSGFWVILSNRIVGQPLPRTNPAMYIAQQQRCPFCSGREQYTPWEINAYGRSGAPNTPGWQVRVIPNAVPALSPEYHDMGRRGNGIYDTMNALGANEVIIETPDHDKDFAELDPQHVNVVVQAWRDRVNDLHKDQRMRYAMIVKNHGPLAGARLAHAHSQLFALPTVPQRVATQLSGASAYYDLKERCAYCDLLKQERADGERLVYENDTMAVLCPFASRFPFELMLLPKRHSASFTAMTPAEQTDLADAVVTAARALNASLDSPDYNMLLITAPNPSQQYRKWPTLQHDFHWHLEIVPRLFSAAGFEWGTGCYVNPTAPEDAAAYLRERRTVQADA